MSNKAASFNKLKAEVLSCIKCKLATTRQNVVFGEGNSNADIMFIGEGPGKVEDETGRPFVGRSGELLTKIIENGLGIAREKVFIANIVKCRPTIDMLMKKDRPPDSEEIDACNGYLLEQIKLIEPRVIITLGNPSTRFILNTQRGITKLRGNWHEFHGIKVMPTYHPSYVLRNGGDKSPLKKDVWRDIQKVIEYLGLKKQDRVSTLTVS